MRFDNLIEKVLNETLKPIISPDLLASREAAQKEDEEKNQASVNLKNSGLKYVIFPTQGTPSGVCKAFKGEFSIIRDAGRDIVLIDLGNIKMPFYKSTGDAGKERVEKDKWYPFFGVQKGWQWFNKCSQTQMSNYYGSEILRKVSEKLNSVLGSGVCGWSYRGWGEENGSKIWEVLNQDLAPTGHESGPLIYANIANVLAKVGGRFILNINGKKGSMSLRLPTDINSAVIERIVGEDAKYFSNPQYSFYKPEKFHGVLWAIKPNPDATNKTYINNQELVQPMIIAYGNTIAIGNKKVGEITIDT